MYTLIIIISLFFQEGNFEIVNDKGEVIAASAENNGRGDYVIGSSNFIRVSSPANTTIEYIDITLVRGGMGIEQKKSEEKIDMSYFNEKLTTKDTIVVVVKAIDEKGKSNLLYYVLKVKKSE